MFQAESTGSGFGVLGQSSLNAGVVGQSSSSIGVYGVSSSGTGVLGTSASIGVRAASSGIALQASGRLSFSTSGVATIAAGSTSTTVSPAVNVTSGSFVLLTPKANIGSRALWFTTDATNDRFTIRMSSSRASGTKVAWLLLG